MTSPTATPPDRFYEVSRRLFWWLGQAALILALWFALIRFPKSPSAGLDPSWQMALGYAMSHSFQFGTDLVFTYGPLGYLMSATNLGDQYYWHHIAWQLGANLVFAVIFYLQARSLRGWRRAVYFLFFFCFGTAYIDTVHIMAILILGLALTREAVMTRRWLAALLAVLLGIFALVKFTNLILAGFTIACAAGLQISRRRWLDAAVPAVAFGAAFLAGWLGFGQHLGNLWPYLRTSLEVSGGYSEGMGLYGPTSMLLLGLGAAASLGIYYLLTLYRTADLRRAIAVMLMAAAASYLNWKHGFVRADGHVLAHFYLSLLFVCAFPVLLQDGPALYKLKGALLVACGACCMIGTWRNSPPAVANGVAFFNFRFMDSVNNLSVFQDLCRNSRDEFKLVKEQYRLPASRTLAGSKPVDILGNDQAFAFFNELNYRPRPVFQSYFPYTEKLQRLNGDFMRSDRAPEFMLQRVQTIDYRLPALEDSLTTRYLYHHYSFMMEEEGFLLWQRNAPDPALDVETPLAQATLRFGEAFSPPETGADPLWCEIDVQPSLLGKIRAFLYKPPFLQISVTDSTGFTASYRMVSGMARAGFLLSPYFSSNYQISRFAQGADAVRVTKFTVELDPSYARYFRPEIKVRLAKLAPFTRTNNATRRATEMKYRVFSQVPTATSTAFPPDITVEGGKEVLLVHAPSELEFQVTDQNRHITGHFGLIGRSYSEGNTTDGAEFIVEWIDTHGKMSRMFYRHLQPLTYPQDRGEQSFDFTVPAGGGRLLLKTTPGPAGNLAYDWAYWTGVKFAP